MTRSVRTTPHVVSTIHAVVLGFLMIAPGTMPAARAAQDGGSFAEQGAAALAARRFGDALEAFARAAERDPRDAGVCLGAGMAAFMLGRNGDAEAWLARALALEPGLVAASLWLGELQYREGRIKEAIATYEAALPRTQDRRELTDRLAAWRKEMQLQDRFYSSRGAHFTVRFEGPADDALARSAVDRLEAAYWRVGQALGAYPSGPVEVVLYTTEQFRDITRAPDWSAAAYDGRIRVPVRGAQAQLDQLDRVLTHEFVHALVGAIGGRTVPTWLNEGLAVTFDRGGADMADAVLSPGSPRPRLQDLHNGFGALSARDAAAAYALSARAVRRMIELRGPSQIVALLRDLARGAAFAGAFHQRMAMRYDEFEAVVASR